MHAGSLNINMFEVVFWEGGRRSQKEHYVYAFDNVDNCIHTRFKKLYLTSVCDLNMNISSTELLSMQSARSFHKLVHS